MENFLAEILVRRGVVPPERLDEALQTAREKGQPLSDVLITAKITDAESIARALADELGLAFTPSIDIAAVSLPITERIPITYAKLHALLVIGEDDTHVHCVTATPLDVTAVDDVRAVFGKTVELSVATNAVVIDAINRVWERKEDGGSGLEAETQVDDDTLVDILDADDEAPIIAWVNSLFSSARATSTSSPRNATSSYATGSTVNSTSRGVPRSNS